MSIKKVVIRLIKKSHLERKPDGIETKTIANVLMHKLQIIYIINSSEIITFNSFRNRVSDKTIYFYPTEIANGNNLGR